MKIGSRVRVKGSTEHPEDPVGIVVMFLNDSPHNPTQDGVVVRFPNTGAEIYSPDELEEVPPSDCHPAN